MKLVKGHQDFNEEKKFLVHGVAHYKGQPSLVEWATPQTKDVKKWHPIGELQLSLEQAYELQVQKF